MPPTPLRRFTTQPTLELGEIGRKVVNEILRGNRTTFGSQSDRRQCQVVPSCIDELLCDVVILGLVVVQ